MYSAIGIAKYVINRYSTFRKPTTNLKLQKTLYYIQGYFLKLTGEKAFSDNIESWKYGPVVPSVYYEYCSYVSGEINENYDLDSDVILINKHKEDCKIINQVVDKCKEYTAIELVNKTHLERPWAETESSQVISEDKIRSYFMNADPLEVESE